MNELRLTGQFLRDKLLADAALSALVQTRVFRNLAPSTAGHPLIVFSLQSSPDRTAVGNQGVTGRIFTRPLYLVEAINTGDDDTAAQDIADLIDTALVGISDLAGADGLIKLGTIREEPTERVVYIDKVRYNHVGGRYRFFVHRA